MSKFFKAFAKTTFIKLQNAWTARDWKIIRPFESNELFEQHKRSNADITVVCKTIEENEASGPLETYIYTDENGNVKTNFGPFYFGVGNILDLRPYGISIHSFGVKSGEFTFDYIKLFHFSGMQCSTICPF